MGFLQLLGVKQKKKKKTVKKMSTVQKSAPKQVKTTMQSSVEEPMISFSRQLTLIQGELRTIETLLQSGFGGLRDDHHRILEEYEKGIETRKETLEKAKKGIEEEIELLEIDSKLLNLLKEKNVQSATVAETLGVTRQYAATRLNELVRLGYARKNKKGRKIYYKKIEK